MEAALVGPDFSLFPVCNRDKDLARQVEDRDCELALYLSGIKDGQESFVLGHSLCSAVQPRAAAGSPAAHLALELAETSGSWCQPGFLFHFIWPQNTHQNGNRTLWIYLNWQRAARCRATSSQAVAGDVGSSITDMCCSWHQGCTLKLGIGLCSLLA